MKTIDSMWYWRRWKAFKEKTVEYILLLKLQDRQLSQPFNKNL
jgi:hypothetical protein